MICEPYIVIGIFFGGWCGMIFSAILVNQSAYRLGVTEGYGYAKEPCNLMYDHAGEYLKSKHADRWPELRRNRDDD